ncbi:F0F1 ATP synthase subunit A [Aeromicrobium sp. UC242_57]|uniref:F0F1 ATP synthase subunit A n=1 Tax=Aeromicrobium sp. UC242_57 TaxID=3374624 RepID=UPI003787F4B4
MLLLTFSAVLIIVLTYAASRKAEVVPGRLQFAGEAVYGFVRNGIARDSIGSHDFMKFVPYLFSLFLFLFVNNYYGVIPFLQFPSSRASATSTDSLHWPGSSTTAQASPSTARSATSSTRLCPAA